MASTQGEGSDSSDPWQALDSEALSELFELLSVRLPDVFKAHRVIEQRTRYLSEAGRNNLVDVLSHVSTLAQGTGHLTVPQQRDELAHIREHMKRVLIEAPEQVVRAKLADIEPRWAEYEREATPYRQAGTLRGVPPHHELETLRENIRRLMDAGRERKRDATWEAWKEGAADMTEAAVGAEELADKLERCIGQAQHLRREDDREERAEGARTQGETTGTRRFRTSLFLGVCGILLSIGFFAFGRTTAPTSEVDRPPPPAVKQQQPSDRSTQRPSERTR